MWELDHKEVWVLKNWWFQIVMLKNALESPLDSNPKGNQPWIFTGRTDVKAEAPILWPPDAKSWLIGKDRDAGKDWRQEEKGMTEDEMVGWHHWFNGHEAGQNSRSLIKLMSFESVMPSNHPLSSPYPTFSLSQHHGLFKWVTSSHQVAKVLEFQFQHQSFQWTFRTDFL